MHLYDKDGSPVYEVPYCGKKKGTRKATLRDAKKEGYCPSVTEILKIMAAPGLERWKQKESIMAALTLPRELEDTDEMFIHKIFADSKEKAQIAADEGTKIHHAIERAFQARLVDSKYFDLAYGVKEKIIEKYGDALWQVEKSFAHPLGYGGLVDLHAAHPINILIDHKTKEVLKDKMAYDNHIMQLAAYRRGLGLPDDTILANVFVGWNGDVVIHEWTKEEAERGLKMFDACFDLWKLSKKYDPSF
jgi:hypothetical protein